jgi:hypothetical protein
MRKTKKRNAPICMYEHQVHRRTQIRNWRNYTFLSLFYYTGCPKKMYTHKVNIPYYNVYTSFWDILYLLCVTKISEDELPNNSSCQLARAYVGTSCTVASYFVLFAVGTFCTVSSYFVLFSVGTFYTVASYFFFLSEHSVQ